MVMCFLCTIFLYIFKTQYLINYITFICKEMKKKNAWNRIIISKYDGEKLDQVLLIKKEKNCAKSIKTLKCRLVLIKWCNNSTIIWINHIFKMLVLLHKCFMKMCILIFLIYLFHLFYLPTTVPPPSSPTLPSTPILHLSLIYHAPNSLLFPSFSPFIQKGGGFPWTLAKYATSTWGRIKLLPLHQCWARQPM